MDGMGHGSECPHQARTMNYRWRLSSAYCSFLSFQFLRSTFPGPHSKRSPLHSSGKREWSLAHCIVCSNPGNMSFLAQGAWSQVCGCIASGEKFRSTDDQRYLGILCSLPKRDFNQRHISVVQQCAEAHEQRLLFPQRTRP